MGYPCPVLMYHNSLVVHSLWHATLAGLLIDRWLELRSPTNQTLYCSEQSNVEHHVEVDCRSEPGPNQPISPQAGTDSEIN
jgi:hypothetical protein